MDQGPTQHSHSDSPFLVEAGAPAGAHALLNAYQLARNKDWSAATDYLAQARSAGIPAELMPHAAMLEAHALSQCGDAAHALAIASSGWADFPDFAALPALAGALEPDESRALRLALAALADEDPENSLTAWGPEVRAAATARLSQSARQARHSQPSP